MFNSRFSYLLLLERRRSLVKNSTISEEKVPMRMRLPSKLSIARTLKLMDSRFVLLS